MYPCYVYRLQYFALVKRNLRDKSKYCIDTVYKEPTAPCRFKCYCEQKSNSSFSLNFKTMLTKL